MTNPLSFNELVPVKRRDIGEIQVQTVNARQLHAALMVGRDFATWIKARIDRYGFTENVDFVTEVFTKTGENSQSPDRGIDHTGGKPVVDYHLSIGMAKELAMVENNDRGRAVRRHFIECERLVLDAMGNGGQFDMKAVGGMMKGIIQKQVNDAIRVSLPQIVATAIANDPRVAVEEYVSVRQLLDEAKALQKGRRSLNRKIGNRLRDAIAQVEGISAKRAPYFNVWLFPVTFAKTWMREHGASLVVDHNARMSGQGVIRFPRRGSKPASDTSH